MFLSLSVANSSNYFCNHQIKSVFILNKMYFYYFLRIFPSDFADFAGFLSVLRVVCQLSWSPIQELEPDATPCRGGRCAAAILADCQQLKKILRL